MIAGALLISWYGSLQKIPAHKNNKLIQFKKSNQKRES